ncbi:4Fe-4S ferredoxin [bacterium J17]|nr:4Fe-4S ferredoxin [bacterium J17]
MSANSANSPLQEHLKNVGKMLCIIGFIGMAALAAKPELAASGTSWTPFILTLGIISLASLVWISAIYSGTVPGIKHDGIMFSGEKSRGTLAWAFGVGITAFYVILYFYEKLQSVGLPPVLDGWVAMLQPMAQLLGRGDSDKWFLYGTFYTLAVLIMGWRMLYKYRHNRYQMIRTLSVMFFQLGFAFLLPNFLRSIQQPEFYFSYFWPLKYDYLFPSTFKDLTSKGNLGVFMFFWGAAMALIATPVLTYLFGKRWYCSWVCGCGGLAETLGDPFRHLSDKSETSWIIERWMIHLVLVVIVLLTAMLWLNDLYGHALFGGWTMTIKEGYGFYIGAIFSGVIGVGFYPIMGSRVWCRFGCPMAAILGIFQRCFSRFRITTNGAQCISCGNCSTYCEMGIDVRAYAQRQENIVRASCVGCGVCAAVCPRGVLKLENGPSYKSRFAEGGSPLVTLKDSILNRRAY